MRKAYPAGAQTSLPAGQAVARRGHQHRQLDAEPRNLLCLALVRADNQGLAHHQYTHNGEHYSPWSLLVAFGTQLWRRADELSVFVEPSVPLRPGACYTPRQPAALHHAARP